MKTRTISFRCPEEILNEIDILCQHNRVDRSTYIVQALQSLFSGLANEGVCSPKEPLPAAPDATEKPAQ